MWDSVRKMPRTSWLGPQCGEIPNANIMQWDLGFRVFLLTGRALIVGWRPQKHMNLKH